MRLLAHLHTRGRAQLARRQTSRTKCASGALSRSAHEELAGRPTSGRSANRRALAYRSRPDAGADLRPEKGAQEFAGWRNESEAPRVWTTD